MPKRLVVCCDGTWNRPDQFSDGVPATTNVAKIALGLADRDEAGMEQVLYYQPGVGSRRWERIQGGAFGIGLSRNVRDCYRFLVEAYEPGDELFLFGFSRGAYTARSTVGLARNAGILRPEHRGRIRDAYRMYRSRSKGTHPREAEARIFRSMYSYPGLEFEFVGVWDTVGALGIPIDGVRLPIITKLWSFHDTNLSSTVKHAYQALAIDEHRRSFRPTVWNQPDPDVEQDLEQVWFAGDHCDAGGGHADPTLSEIALGWMVERARACGLAFQEGWFGPPTGKLDERRRFGQEIAPSPYGLLHPSPTGLYKLLGSIDRTIEGDGASAASSAIKRMRRESCDYAPPALTDFHARFPDRVTPVPDGTGAPVAGG
jgi:uncharacterized protein (DUF2235 family)